MRYLYSLLFSLFVCLNITAQVNLQTGSATFSLPIFEWKDDKSKLNSLLTLTYNSGNGFRVNDVASNIGQGWNLIQGGAITRLQVGEPDDQKGYEGNYTIEDVTKYPPGYLYNSINAKNGCPQALTKYPIFKDENHLYKQPNAVAADREVDHFAFQFNGRSGIFILGKNNGDKGILLEDSRMKIWFVRNESMGSSHIDQGLRTTISTFYIQDENGLIYKFNNRELTKILQTKYCDDKFTAQLTQPTFEGGNVYHESAFDNHNLVNPYTVNTWYLSEVQDPLTLRKIIFTYSTRNVNALSGTAINYYKEKDYSVISHSTSVTQTPVISTVKYPDEHQVVFNYGKDRIDLKGDKALESIDITYSGRSLSKYQFKTDYFILNRIGTPSTDFQKCCARLCLLSVKKIGVDLKADESPYIFNYYLGGSSSDDIIPPPFNHAKDIWGFYNGNNSRAYNGTSIISPTAPIASLSNSDLKGLCFLRNGSNTILYNAKPDYAKNGLLKEIVYPTGGTLSYQYTQNKAELNNQNIDAGGVHVASTKVTDGGYNNNCDDAIITNYKYELANTKSSLWGIETPVNSVSVSSYYSPEDKKWKWWQPGCFFKYKYPGIVSREQAISLTGHQQFLMTLSKVMDVVSTIMTIVDIVNVCLAATPVAIIAVVIDAIAIIVNIVFSCFGSRPEQNETSTAYYNSDMNGSNPLPVQFSRVVVTEGSGSNGSTVFDFTSPSEYAIWELTNPRLLMNQRYAHYAYGLPLKTTVFDAAGLPVKQSENKYNFDLADKPDWTGHPGGTPDHDPIPRLTSCKCFVNKSFSQRNTSWVEPSPYQTSSSSDLSVDFYKNHLGRVELEKSFERTYKPGSSTIALESYTEYKYDPFNYMVINSTKKESNGNLTYKNIKYSSDFKDIVIDNGPSVPNTFYSAGILNTLNQNNIISTPVTTETSIYDNTGLTTGYLHLNESVTEFTTTANGDIKPSRILEQRFAKPQELLKPDPNGQGYISNWQSYILPNHPNNPAYKETQNFTYDAKGNLTGIKDEGNRKVLNIYDYNDKFVVASVINADPLLDKAAYTSFETDNLGGWIISGSANFVSTSAVTGKNSLGSTSSIQLSANINSSKSYILSYWSNNGALTVSGSGVTLIKSAPVINGYTYYEYTIASGNSAVTLTGNSNIDELRLYPQMSRIRTVTYDPLIGKTSECDENNRITYYEYDDLGRLRFIKDESKNVVKMYEYNSLKKQTSCTLFSNNAISEIFTKNDCGIDYIGGDYLYTIPAGRYTSAVSQAAVDGQVQNELNTLGQAAANSHASCIRQFVNEERVQSFINHNCPPGYVGSSVQYTVPPGRYTSLTSQADANNKADLEIKANGQAFANMSGNTNCIIDQTPDWVSVGGATCETATDGTYTGNQITQFIDQNPNSPTYNQTEWINTGTTNTTACSGTALRISYTNNAPGNFHVIFTNKADGLNYYDDYFIANQTASNVGIVPAGVYDISITAPTFGVQSFSYQVGSSASVNVPSSLATDVTISSDISVLLSNLVYYNSAVDQNFTKNDCPAGYSGPVVNYSVPAGTYTSTLNADAANAMAQDDISANGQAYANNNGLCIQSAYNIFLTNNSGITGATFTVHIDGIPYEFPDNGVSGALTARIAPGNHTFNFPCGPNLNFGISNSPIPSCGNDFDWPVNNDLTIVLGPANEFTGNLASTESAPPNFCCENCYQVMTVYCTSTIIHPGVRLYFDSELTQPVLGTWFYPYSEAGTTIYELDGSGMVIGTTDCE